MQSKLEIVSAVLFGEVIFCLFNTSAINRTFFVCFFRAGILLLCKHSCIYVGFGEETDKKYNVKLKDSSLQDTKVLQQSSTIICFRVSSRKLNSVQGTTGGHHWEPPAFKVQNSGALESRSDLDFPLHNFQWTPSIFFSAYRYCRILYLVSSHSVL